MYWPSWTAGPRNIFSETIEKRQMLLFNNSIIFKIQRARQLWAIWFVAQKKQNWHPLEVSSIQMVNQSLVQNHHPDAYWIKMANLSSHIWVSLPGKISIKLAVLQMIAIWLQSKTSRGCERKLYSVCSEPVCGFNAKNRHSRWSESTLINHFRSYNNNYRYQMDLWTGVFIDQCP